MIVAPQPAPRLRAEEHGFVIVTVLWFIAALATLAAVYSVYASSVAAASHVTDDRLQSNASIEACIELVAYQLTAGTAATRPTQGAFTFRVGRSTVTARYTSEAARIDLNAAPKELLAGLFKAVGATSARADFYADRIVGWRKKTDEATDDAVNNEAEAYQKAGRSYRPREAPFTDVLELPLVLGIPSDMVARVLPFVTIYNGSPQVDVADAVPEVIDALPGMTPAILRAALSVRAREPRNGDALLASLGPARDLATTDGGRGSRVSIDVALDDSRRIHAEVVILILEDDEEPYRVLYWHDDFDGPF